MTEAEGTAAVEGTTGAEGTEEAESTKNAVRIYRISCVGKGGGPGERIGKRRKDG